MFPFEPHSLRQYLMLQALQNPLQDSLFLCLTLQGFLIPLVLDAPRTSGCPVGNLITLEGFPPPSLADIVLASSKSRAPRLFRTRNTCSATTLTICRQSHSVGFVSDVHCIQVRLAVVNLIVVFVVQLQVCIRCRDGGVHSLRTHDANSPALMRQSLHHMSTATRKKDATAQHVPTHFCPLETVHKQTKNQHFHRY